MTATAALHAVIDATLLPRLEAYPARVVADYQEALAWYLRGQDIAHRGGQPAGAPRLLFGAQRQHGRPVAEVISSLLLPGPPYAVKPNVNALLRAIGAAAAEDWHRALRAKLTDRLLPFVGILGAPLGIEVFWLVAGVREVELAIRFTGAVIKITTSDESVRPMAKTIGYTRWRLLVREVRRPDGRRLRAPSLARALQFITEEPTAPCRQSNP